MPAQVTPILKKKEDEQTTLLKKILGKVGAEPMPGLEGEKRRQPIDAFAQLGASAGIRVV